MIQRDPYIDPQEGDVIDSPYTTNRVVVDGVRRGDVLYRVVDAAGGLVDARCISLASWRSFFDDTDEVQS